MKKVIIFTSTGGGGHISVSNALEKYLEDSYKVIQCYTFKEVLNRADLLYIITMGKFTGEDLYNFFVPRKYYVLLNWYYKFGRIYYKILRKKTFQLLEEYIQTNKPDVIISAIPIINDIFLDIAKKHDIPMLLIPTDLDSRTFLLNFKNPNYEKFRFCFPFDDPDVRSFIAPAHIPPAQVITTGFVLRPDFFKEKNIPEIKKEFLIPENKPVIMILMGGMGSEEIVNYMQKLSSLAVPAHIIACIGRTKSQQKKLELITFPSHITSSIIGYTERISDLMAISDLLISKSGSVSVCESIYSHLPILLDATSTILTWEQFNHYFIKKHGFGDSIKMYSDIVPMVTNLLKNQQELKNMKKKLESFEKKEGGKEIKKIIDKLFF